MCPVFRSPASIGSTPARIFSIVVFPAPFGPTSATRSPRSSVRSIPRYTGTSPYDLLTPRSEITSLPLRGGAGNEYRTFFVARGSLMTSIFSSCFSRLCTWLAFVAFARNASTNRICFLISRCCRAAAARFVSSALSRAARYSS